MSRGACCWGGGHEQGGMSRCAGGHEQGSMGRGGGGGGHEPLRERSGHEPLCGAADGKGRSAGSAGRRQTRKGVRSSRRWSVRDVESLPGPLLLSTPSPVNPEPWDLVSAEAAVVARIVEALPPPTTSRPAASASYRRHALSARKRAAFVRALGGDVGDCGGADVQGKDL
jgi:hypothetical protein